MNPLESKLSELRQRFVDRSGDELAALDAALAGGERDSVIDRAHRLAGISGMFGFDELGHAASELEQAALSGSDFGIPARRLRALLAELSAA